MPTPLSAVSASRPQRPKRPVATTLACFALVGAALSLSGCVTYLLAGDVKDDIENARIAHHYAFMKGQQTKMREAGACAVAATYWAEMADPTRTRGKGLSGPEITNKADEFRADAVALRDACMADEVPKLTAARRYARLATTLRALSELPLVDADKQALVQRADKVDLVRAEAAVTDADAAWAKGQIDTALSGYQNAKFIAGACAAATADEKQKYAALLDTRTNEAVAQVSEKATAAEAKGELHLAAIYWAKALSLRRTPQALARLDAARKALLSSNVYRFQIEWKGESRIIQAAKDTVRAHSFTGNLKADSAGEFSAVIDVGAFAVSPNEREGSRTGEYKTGSESVDNPEYRELQAFIMKQQGCLASLNTVSYHTNQVFADQNKRGCATNCSTYECAYKNNKDRMTQAQAKLAQTPMVKQKDIMASWSYATREWSQVLTAPMTLSLKHALEAAPSTSTKTLRHEYTDYAHDLVPQLGLGKKQIVKQTDAELAARAGLLLGNDVIIEIERDYQAWLAATPSRGERGAVLFVLLGGEGGNVDARLEAATGVKNATQLLRAH